ncbi:uncharacterized protein [Antedon mediterranea]|uniref:uncharacterized protein isoform X2 n=1 Tax=Antedon mediterranea TaxID=105859 RepID=UPI003AF9C986
MDDFKMNAAKMIAAQQRKNRAQSPETESNWDSSEPEDNVPQISSDDEESFKYTPKKQTQRQNNNKSYNNSTTQNSTPPVAAAYVKQERHSNRNSPALSTKSASKRNQKDVNVFVDNGFDSDENEPVSSTIKRKPKEEVPPYDFKGVIKEGRDPSKQTTQPTGKHRKGQLYDVSTKQESKSQNGSAFDSDEEREMLAEIRTEMKKVNKNHLDVPKGRDVRQRVSDNQPTVSKSTPKVSKVKEDKKSDLFTVGVPASNRGQESLENTGQLELQSVTMSEKGYPTQPSGNIGTRYVYHYEHGSLEYYDTRNGREEIYMANIADKSEKLVRRGIQEVFAAFRILVDFIIILVLETIRFLAYNILQTLIVGVFTVLGDYLLKPILTGLFNSILQPISTFVYNVAVATRTVMVPVGDTLKIIFTPLIMLVKAFRLFEVNLRSNKPENIHQIEDV